MIVYNDEKYKFNEIFNEKNGFLIRSNIIDENGNETNEMPQNRSFPELIDIGIMGKCHVYKKYCKEFGIDCYQCKDNNDMPLKLYKKIIKECKNKTFQVALGGKGDPNKHENFEEILRYTREQNIIPNLTTTGINITEKEINLIKRYVGAVAVSLYSKINEKNEESNLNSIEAIEKMVKAGITTNIHYVINNDTIDDAIKRIKYEIFPKGINAVVFLLYKNDTEELFIEKEKIEKFFKIINSKKLKQKIGFDTCFSPLLFRYMKEASKYSIEPCEAGKFSCYIDPDGFLYPCSFLQNKFNGIDLKNRKLIEAWNGNEMKEYRALKCNNCNKCKNNCKYGCKGGLNQYSCKII